MVHNQSFQLVLFVNSTCNHRVHAHERVESRYIIGHKMRFYIFKNSCACLCLFFFFFIQNFTSFFRDAGLVIHFCVF